MRFDELGDASLDALVTRLYAHNNWDVNAVTKRSMFATVQYFKNDAVFLKEVKGVIYLRVAENMIPQWKSVGSHPCPLSREIEQENDENDTINSLSLESLMSKASTLRRTQPYANKPRDLWYSVPPTCNSIHDLARLVVDSYLVSYGRVLQKGQALNLRDLPNISSSILRMLRTVNIKTISDLRSVGHNSAYKQIVVNYPFAGYSVLFSLYGALNGFHYGILEEQQKEQLVQCYSNYYNQSQLVEIQEKIKLSHSQ